MGTATRRCAKSHPVTVPADSGSRPFFTFARSLLTQRRDVTQNNPEILPSPVGFNLILFVIMRRLSKRIDSALLLSRRRPIKRQTIYLSFSRLLSTGPVEDDGREQFLLTRQPCKSLSVSLPRLLSPTVL